MRIPGFDLGNSPLEYTPDRVAGRPVVITTTNGTAALAACQAAREVLVGAIVNCRSVAAVARRLADTAGAPAVHLVCAGTDGEITAEDVLAAGAILAAAARDPAADTDTLDAAAQTARELFDHLAGENSEGLPARITTAFRTCRGGENLLALGMEADLAAAAAIDSLAVVPRLEGPGGGLVATR